MYNVFPSIFIYDLFADNVNSSDQKASNDRMWKVAVMTYFEVLS
jgi:hypothetical protein